MVLGSLLGLLPFRCDLCCSTFSADDVKLAVEDDRTGSVRSRTAAEQVERAMKRSVAILDGSAILLGGLQDC